MAPTPAGHRSPRDCRDSREPHPSDRALTLETTTHARATLQRRDVTRGTREDRAGCGAPDAAQAHIVIQRSGESALHQVSRSCRIGPGDMVLFDTSLPYQLEHLQDGEQLVLSVRLGDLDLPTRALERLKAVPIRPDNPLQVMARQALDALSAHPSLLQRPTGPRLSTAVLGLVVTVLNDHVDQLIADRGTQHDLLRATIHDYIEQHLGDPELTPTTVAAAHFISVRTLHQVFAAVGTTVAASIRSRRLARCRAQLADPSMAEVPVSQIATAWGFTNPAHFSRIFRAEYGSSPARYRAEQLS